MLKKISALLFVAVVLFSCKSTNQYSVNIQKRKHRSGYHIDISKKESTQSKIAERKIVHNQTVERIEISRRINKINDQFKETDKLKKVESQTVSSPKIYEVNESAFISIEEAKKALKNEPTNNNAYSEPKETHWSTYVTAGFLVATILFFPLVIFAVIFGFVGLTAYYSNPGKYDSITQTISLIGAIAGIAILALIAIFAILIYDDFL